MHAMLPKSSHNNLLYNLSTLSQLCNNNAQAIKNMITTFCIQTPNLINQLNEAYQQNNGELVSNIAHKLKPSIDYLQINSLKEVVREIERNAKEANQLSNLTSQVFRLQNILNLVVEDLQKEV